MKQQQEEEEYITTCENILSKQDANILSSLVQNEYLHRWTLSLENTGSKNAVVNNGDDDNNTNQYHRYDVTFPVGSYLMTTTGNRLQGISSKKRFHIHNHVTITLDYEWTSSISKEGEVETFIKKNEHDKVDGNSQHTKEGQQQQNQEHEIGYATIIGFAVKPSSISHNAVAAAATNAAKIQANCDSDKFHRHLKQHRSHRKRLHHLRRKRNRRRLIRYRRSQRYSDRKRKQYRDEHSPFLNHNFHRHFYFRRVYKNHRNLHQSRKRQTIQSSSLIFTTIFATTTTAITNIIPNNIMRKRYNLSFFNYLGWWWWWFTMFGV